MPREKNFPEHLAARVSTAAVAKLDEAAERLGVDRAQVVRWWVDEMPEGYVPARWKARAPAHQSKHPPYPLSKMTAAESAIFNKYRWGCCDKNADQKRCEPGCPRRAELKALPKSQQSVWSRSR